MGIGPKNSEVRCLWVPLILHSIHEKLFQDIKGLANLVAWSAPFDFESRHQIDFLFLDDDHDWGRPDLVIPGHFDKLLGIDALVGNVFDG